MVGSRSTSGRVAAGCVPTRRRSGWDERRLEHPRALLLRVFVASCEAFPASTPAGSPNETLFFLITRRHEDTKRSCWVHRVRRGLGTQKLFTRGSGRTLPASNLGARPSPAATRAAFLPASPSNHPNRKITPLYRPAFRGEPKSPCEPSPTLPLKSSRKDVGGSRSTCGRVAAGCVPTRHRSGWATAAWARVASSEVTSASICDEAGGFPACSRWSRSEATTPPGTHANVSPCIPAGMPAPGAGPGWHPSRVRRVMGIGDRSYRFAQPPATCRETFGFRQGIPCGPSFEGPRRHSPGLGCPVFLERVNG